MSQIYLDPKPGKIHGFVKVNTAEDPIDNVTIIVSGNSTLTGATGEFIVEADVGPQKMMVYHPDYETQIVEVTVEKNSINEIGTIYMLPRPGTVVGTTVPAEATVEFYGNFKNYTVTSDIDGDFKIDEIAADIYLMSVSKAGYYTKSRKNIVINNGSTTDVGYVALEPEVGNIKGRVTREDLVGIDGAFVDSGFGIVTDQDGYFTLSGLHAGTTTITVSADGFKSKTLAGISVIANSTNDIGDIKLEALDSGLGDLEVEIFDMGGTPISGTATLVEREESIATNDINNYKALWEGIPRGPYTVKAEAPGYYTYYKDAVVFSDDLTTIKFNLIDESKIVDNLIGKIDDLEDRAANWDKDIGYPVEESYTLTEDLTPMDYKLQYAGPEDILVGSSLEDPNAFFDFIDENNGELFDAGGNAVEVISIEDENGYPLPHTDTNGNDIPWYGKGVDEEIHLVLSATPVLPEGLTDIVVRYAVRKTMRDLAVDALIKRGVTAKEVDVSVVDTISQLKGAGFHWNEPMPENSTLIGMESRLTENEGDLTSQSTKIGQNETDIGLHADRIKTTEDGVETNSGNITINAKEISSNVSRLDTNEGNITAAQSDIIQNAEGIYSTVNQINIDEGSYLELNGVDSWIEIDTIAPSATSNLVSLRTRVMFNDFEGHQAIFTNGGLTNGFEFGLYNNQLTLSVVDEGVIYTAGYSVDNLETEKWYNLEAVADGVNGTLTININGKEVVSETVVAFSGFDGTEGSFIGTTMNNSPSSLMTSADPANFLEGFIDEVQIWSEKSTNKEITDIDGSEAGLLYAWEINEGFGTTVNEINSLNNGILHSCEWLGMESNTTRVRQLSDEFTVKITEHANGEDVISGFGLASEDGETEFAVMADRFYIFGDSTDGAEPGLPVFAVDAETGNIYLEADLVASGSITGEKLAAASLITQAAQIENALITTAHIDYLEIDKLDVRGRLTADHIVVGNASLFEDGYNPKVISEKLTEDINDLNKSFLALGNQLSQFTNDGELSRIEAETLRGSFNRFKSEWQSLNTVASTIIANDTENTTELASQRTATEQAVSELELELNSWIDLPSYPVTITDTNKTNIETKFQNALDAKAQLLNSITKYRQQAAINWADAEIGKFEGKLQDQIDDFSKDNILIRAEANALETTLNQLVAESQDLIYIAEQNEITMPKDNYSNAIDELETLLLPWIALSDDKYPLDITTTSTTRAMVDEKFSEVQNAKSILSNSITEYKMDDAKKYSEAGIINDIKTHVFHFDTHLTSTKGAVPRGMHEVSLRPMEGKYKGGVAIEEATENLWLNDSGRPNSFTAKGTTPPTVEVVDEDTVWGSEVLKVIIPANNDVGPDGCSVETDAGSINYDGSPYSYFSYIKGETSGVKLQAVGDINFPSATKKDYLNVGDWEYHVKENSFDESTGSGNLKMSYSVEDSSVNARVFYIAVNQLENKAFSTSYMNGTRYPGILGYSIDDFGLRPDSGTIAFKFRVPDFTRFETGYKRLFSIGDSAGEGQYLGYYSPAEKLFKFRIHNGTTNYEMYSSHSYSLGYHSFAYTWSSDEIAMYIDGVKSSRSNFILPVSFADNMLYLGSSSDNKDYANGIFDELLISPIHYNSEMIKNWSEMRTTFDDVLEKITVTKPTNVVIGEV